MPCSTRAVAIRPPPADCPRQPDVPSTGKGRGEGVKGPGRGGGCPAIPTSTGQSEHCFLHPSSFGRPNPPQSKLARPSLSLMARRHDGISTPSRPSLMRLYKALQASQTPHAKPSTQLDTTRTVLRPSLPFAIPRRFATQTCTRRNAATRLQHHVITSRAAPASQPLNSTQHTRAAARHNPVAQQCFLAFQHLLPCATGPGRSHLRCSQCAILPLPPVRGWRPPCARASWKKSARYCETAGRRGGAGRGVQGRGTGEGVSWIAMAGRWLGGVGRYSAVGGLGRQVGNHVGAQAP